MVCARTETCTMRKLTRQRWLVHQTWTKNLDRFSLRCFPVWLSFQLRKDKLWEFVTATTELRLLTFLKPETKIGLQVGMCGMDFSSSVRFWEKPRFPFGFEKPSVLFGFLCRSVVKYKKKRVTSCLSYLALSPASTSLSLDFMVLSKCFFKIILTSLYLVEGLVWWIVV